MKVDNSYFEDEVREGFYIPGMIKRAWAVQLEVLKVIAEICDKHNIMWYAEGGTLLGAVRHRGFIPWDDDIDICMMRDDYVRFCKLIKEELPEGYAVLNFENEPEYQHFLTRITNSKGIHMDCSFLMKHHGFPYVTGIDIFPLDYLIPDEAKEEERRERAKILWDIVKNLKEGKEKRTEEELIEIAETVSGVCVDRTMPLKAALLRNIDAVFSEYSGENSEYVALMPYWIQDTRIRYALSYFKDSINLPFENTYVKSPAAYAEFLKMDYGKWEHASKAGGCHDYPFYQEQEKILMENQGEVPYRYRMKDSEEIKNEERIKHSLMVDNGKKILQALKKLHDLIFYSIESKDDKAAMGLLEKCQEYAIKVGTDVEEKEGEDFITVRLLEEYCEQVYLLHERVSSGEIKNLLQEKELLKKHITAIENSYVKDIKRKKEILFLPVKAEHWSTMQPFYEEAVKEGTAEVYVMPIPYAERESDGNAGMEHWDLDEFAKSLNVLDYRTYDFTCRHPDKIVIQNPYDEYGSGITVHPFFYAKNIKKHTDKLVYVPYFWLDEIEPEDEKSIKNSQAYIITPGVIHSDEVIVLSQRTKEQYVNCLSAHTLIKDKRIWENRIVVREDIRIKSLENEKQVSGKNNVLYYVGFSDYYVGAEKTIKKVRSMIEEFVIHKNEIKVFWVSEDSFASDLEKLCPQIYKDYLELVRYFEQEGIGECMSMKDVEKAVLVADVFYGTGGYAMNLCERKGISIVQKDMLH